MVLNGDSVMTNDGFEVSSSSTSADDMAAIFDADLPKPEDAKARIIRRETPEEEPETPAAKAARKRDEKTGEFVKGAGKEEPDADESEDEDEPPAKAAKGKTEEPAPKEKKGNPRHDPSARVRLALQETKQEREARIALEQDNARLKGELEAMRRGRSEPTQEPPKRKEAAAESDDDPRPRANDPKWKDWDEYEEARDAWAVRQAEKRLTTTFSEKQRSESRERTFATRQAEATKATEDAGGQEFMESMDQDFLRAIYPASALHPEREVTALNVLGEHLILTGPHFPGLLRYLHENPELRARFARVQPGDEAGFNRALGALEAGYKASRAATTATAPKVAVSQAKPPLRQVKGAPVIAGDDDEDPEDFDAWMAVEDRRDKRRAAQR